VWLTVAPVVGAATLGLRRRADAARRALTELARTDALTGCMNRHGLHEVAARELARIRRMGSPMTVALLDLDHFKRFNDTSSHDAGDGLLRDAAAVWQQALREVDVLARWGGEEFVVLFPDTTPDVAALILDRPRMGTPLGQTCSVGVASIERAAEGDGLVDAIRRADSALYEAKGTGRGRIVVAD
jgi:diguanylate cyclase (GGDEF)-like protein